MKVQLLAVSLFCSTLLASVATIAAPGEEWVYTGQMEMMGMKMPVEAVTLCNAPDQPNVPPLEGNCTYTNIASEGNTTSFEFTCTGSNAAKGSGKSTVTGDSSLSEYTLETDDGSGKITLTGKKGGVCDTAQAPSIKGKSADDMKKKLNGGKE